MEGDISTEDLGADGSGKCSIGTGISCRGDNAHVDIQVSCVFPIIIQVEADALDGAGVTYLVGIIDLLRQGVVVIEIQGQKFSIRRTFVGAHLKLGDSHEVSRHGDIGGADGKGDGVVVLVGEGRTRACLCPVLKHVASGGRGGQRHMVAFVERTVGACRGGAACSGAALDGERARQGGEGDGGAISGVFSFHLDLIGGVGTEAREGAGWRNNIDFVASAHHRSDDHVVNGATIAVAIRVFEAYLHV